MVPAMLDGAPGWVRPENSTAKEAEKTAKGRSWDETLESFWKYAK